MILRAMEEGYPIDYAVFFDTGMEFKCIYRNAERLRPMLDAYGARLVILKPDNNFLWDMLVRPVKYRFKEGEHYGYEWCGGRCRWRIADKIKKIQDFLNSLDDDYTQYVGIAADEPDRIKEENNKKYPLVEWGMSEQDCLDYCSSKGWNWLEGDMELYSVLDRVSCWCCANKNLSELRNMYHYLPEYWSYLKALQSRIDRPFRSGKTIFDLEERFKIEDAKLAEEKAQPTQLEMSDYFGEDFYY